jgi:hypothetical protein
LDAAKGLLFVANPSREIATNHRRHKAAQLLDGLRQQLAQRVSSSSFNFFAPTCTLRNACESAWRISSARVISSRQPWSSDTGT